MYAVVKLTPEILKNLHLWLKENDLILIRNFLVEKQGVEKCFDFGEIDKARHILNCATIVTKDGKTVNDHVAEFKKTAKYTCK